MRYTQLIVVLMFTICAVAMAQVPTGMIVDETATKIATSTTVASSNQTTSSSTGSVKFHLEHRALTYAESTAIDEYMSAFGGNLSENNALATRNALTLLLTLAPDGEDGQSHLPLMRRPAEYADSYQIVTQLVKQLRGTVEIPITTAEYRHPPFIPATPRYDFVTELEASGDIRLVREMEPAWIGPASLNCVGVQTSIVQSAPPMNVGALTIGYKQQLHEWTVAYASWWQAHGHKPPKKRPPCPPPPDPNCPPLPPGTQPGGELGGPVPTDPGVIPVPPAGEGWQPMPGRFMPRRETPMVLPW